MEALQAENDRLAAPSHDLYERPYLFIGGCWTPPRAAARLTVVSPYNEAIAGYAAAAAADDVDDAVAAARAAFDRGPWPRMPPGERASVLRRMADYLAARGDAVAKLITDEMGAPLSRMRMAMPAYCGMLNLNADLIEAYKFSRAMESPAGPGFSLRESIGVVAVITPWNGPLYILLLKCAPALAAGCAVVVKPSPETPLDAFILADAAEAAGLPPGVLNIIPGDRLTGEHLVRHPLVDKVSFTGSTEAGRRIGEVCAAGFRRTALELGGKSAAVILDDADPAAAAAATIAQGIAYNSGQACAALTRILVPRGAQKTYTEALVETARKLVVGNPLDAATEIGPMVTQAHRARVEAYIAAGKAEGARVVLGGGRPAGFDQGWFVEPTLFADVSNDMRIAQEEIFGPVAVIIPYDDDDDAVRIANDSRFGLGGAVFTKDPARGYQIAKKVRTGTFGVNKYFISYAFPFGGVKSSGVGREGSSEGLDAFFETKTIVGLTEEP